MITVPRHDALPWVQTWHDRLWMTGLPLPSFKCEMSGMFLLSRSPNARATCRAGKVGERWEVRAVARWMGDTRESSFGCGMDGTG